jgi:hypothetical protein
MKQFRIARWHAGYLLSAIRNFGNRHIGVRIRRAAIGGRSLLLTICDESKL